VCDAINVRSLVLSVSPEAEVLFKNEKGYREGKLEERQKHNEFLSSNLVNSSTSLSPNPSYYATNSPVRSHIAKVNRKKTGRKSPSLPEHVKKDGDVSPDVSTATVRDKKHRRMSAYDLHHQFSTSSLKEESEIEDDHDDHHHFKKKEKIDWKESSCALDRIVQKRNEEIKNYNRTKNRESSIILAASSLSGDEREQGVGEDDIVRLSRSPSASSSHKIIRRNSSLCLTDFESDQNFVIALQKVLTLNQQMSNVQKSIADKSEGGEGGGGISPTSASLERERNNKSRGRHHSVLIQDGKKLSSTSGSASHVPTGLMILPQVGDYNKASHTFLSSASVMTKNRASFVNLSTSASRDHHYQMTNELGMEPEGEEDDGQRRSPSQRKRGQSMSEVRSRLNSVASLRKSLLVPSSTSFDEGVSGYGQAGSSIRSSFVGKIREQQSLSRSMSREVVPSTSSFAAPVFTQQSDKSIREKEEDVGSDEEADDNNSWIKDGSYDIPPAFSLVIGFPENSQELPGGNDSVISSVYDHLQQRGGEQEKVSSNRRGILSSPSSLGSPTGGKKKRISFSENENEQTDFEKQENEVEKKKKYRNDDFLFEREESKVAVVSSHSGSGKGKNGFVGLENTLGGRGSSSSLVGEKEGKVLNTATRRVSAIGSGGGTARAHRKRSSYHFESFLIDEAFSQAQENPNSLASQLTILTRRDAVKAERDEILLKSNKLYIREPIEKKIEILTKKSLVVKKLN
jgi:hypothetical protein